VVVVAVAAVGLYFAFVTPSATPATSGPSSSSSSIDSIASLDAPASAPTGTVEPTTPPAEAFAAPSSPLTDGPGALTLGPAPAAPATAPTSGAAGTGATALPTTPASASAVIPTGAGAASTAPAVSPRTTVVEPAPAAGGARSYVIRQGDTLEAIARAQLGDGQKWRQIAAANPGVNPNNLKIGQTISIPAGGVEAPRAAGSVGTATPVEGNAYTVQKGDTLVALSRKFYGGDGEWKRILEANRPLLKGDPASLKPGMKLTIPAKR
jgi:nucleoid-associated protein YgaU